MRIFLALALASCAAPWDPPGLRSERAALSGFPAHRLADATPYLLPVRGELLSFFCRWPAGPIPVALPADAAPHERRALEVALEAWEAAGLGVRFERGEGPEAASGIAIELVDPQASPRAEGTGYTLADCRLARIDPASLSGARLPARMERARIVIVRRETELDPAFFTAELTGVALHELAHALGFQGHARFGGGVLARDTKDTTVVGRRVLGGAPLRDDTVRALYALPSGIVLSRVRVPAARTAALDERLAAAAREGLDGPFVRVGDRTGRIFWRAPDGREPGVTLASVVTALDHPERLVLLPDAPPGGS